MSNIIKFKKRRVSQGIILSGTTTSNENGSVAKDLTLQDLMFYGLYWDNVILTQIPNIECSNEAIEQFKSNGVIDFYRNAPPEKMHSSEFQRLALESLIACQSVKKQNKDSDWIIFNNVANGFNTIDSDDLLERDSIRVEIAKCLPYPSTYVPIEVLRKFREDNIEQLDDLHFAKYKLFRTIAEFDDKDKRELARQYEIIQFERAITEYQEVFAARFPQYSLKPLISDIKSNKPQLWEIGVAVGDMALSGGTLSGAYLVGKTLFNMLGSKQKIHEAKQNSPEFHFISSAINEGIILQKIR
ncbi:hypothetical protein E0H88_11940 [Acinetobacter sp. ANC 4216]|uniref:hypothetical protein n=1 Tax=Acinetobacter sp. ANC 4216 TaxID=2529840 RepID=UPI0010394876|nr:hypothetical protein [Acinetobacter sp. ANC 4216]TCB69283.1 hypothetical protein E0H88_11940 [Acinetobacter sp. ANC 4216]